MALAVVLPPHSALIRVHWSVRNQAQEIQKLIMVLNNDLFPHQKLDKNSRFQWFHFPALFFPFMLLSSLTQLETEVNGRSSVCVLSRFSRVWLFATPWTVALQAPLSMGFSRQEYWSGSPNPSPGDLPDPGVKSTSLLSPAVADRFFTTSATWEAWRVPYLVPIVWLPWAFPGGQALSIIFKIPARGNLTLCSSILVTLGFLLFLKRVWPQDLCPCYSLWLTLWGSCSLSSLKSSFKCHLLREAWHNQHFKTDPFLLPICISCFIHSICFLLKC